MTTWRQPSLSVTPPGPPASSSSKDADWSSIIVTSWSVFLSSQESNMSHCQSWCIWNNTLLVELDCDQLSGCQADAGWTTGRTDAGPAAAHWPSHPVSHVVVFVHSVTSAAWSPSRVWGGTVGTVRQTTRSTSAPAAPTCENFLCLSSSQKGAKMKRVHCDEFMGPHSFCFRRGMCRSPYARCWWNWIYLIFYPKWWPALMSFFNPWT